MAAMSNGSNAGRLISAARRTAGGPSTPSAAPTGVGGWTPELLIAGYARVGTNIAPPGLRVATACTLQSAYLRAGTAPTGSSLILLVERSGSTLATLTLAAGSSSTSATGLSVALAAGDIVTFDVTQIGSTVAGADLAVQLVAL